MRDEGKERRETSCLYFRPHPSSLIPSFIPSNYFARHDVESQTLCAADDFERRALTDAFFCQQLVQFIYSGHRLTGEACNDISLLQAASTRRAVLVHLDDEDAMLDLQMIKPDDAARQRNVLPGETYIAAADAPVFYQTPGDELRGVDGNRKADSLRRKDDSRVDADDFAARGDEWAAGIARIERSIGLNDVVNQAARVGS